MSFGSYSVTGKDGVIGQWTLDETYFNDGSLDYMDYPQCTGFSSYHNDFFGDLTYNISGYVSNTPPNRMCHWLYEYRQSQFVNVSDLSVEGQDGGGGNFTSMVAPRYEYNEAYNTNFSGSFSTNVPIFENDTIAGQFKNIVGDTQAIEFIKEYALNYKETEEKKTEDYYIYNTYSDATIEYGEVNFSDTTYNRYERLKMKSTPALYFSDNDPFECHLAYNDNDIVASAYSSISIFEVEINPTWVDGSVTYTYPFYKDYENEVENGDYTIGRTFRTNIPLFANMTDAIAFINGEKPITDAINWRNIAGDYPDIIDNDTGISDEETEFGEVYVQGFFSQQYLCGRTALANIASSFFDIQGADPSIIGVWEEIKKGIEMYGQDPMQAVQGLMYFPIDLSQVFTNTQSQNYIYFGGYKLDLSANVEKLIFANGFKTIGSITINKSFNDWRDYEPYTKLYVYLPYCGTYPLQLSRYYGKTTEVRYYIDTRTGGCLACLIADGMLIDYFNGQMGVQMPITLTDKSEYANTQINTLLKGAGSIASIVTTAKGNISSGGSVPIELAFGALNTGMEITKTEYNLTQNNVTDYNKTTGGSTSMLNEYLPQYVTFMFEVQQIEESANESALQGQPTNASGTIGSFSGYLEVEEVNLICGNATENEKQQIISMLRTGVII